MIPDNIICTQQFGHAYSVNHMNDTMAENKDLYTFFSGEQRERRR
jgi:hypothetical protein